MLIYFNITDTILKIGLSLIGTSPRLALPGYGALPHMA